MIVMPATNNTNYFYAGYGEDVISGRIGTDFVFGDQGNDIIYGRPGFDFLVGGTGNDQLFGDNHDDNLTGGLGADRLTGGAGVDGFHFARGASPSVIGDVDFIRDWQTIDLICSEIKGTTNNYTERATAALNINAARNVAESQSEFDGKIHVYLYNVDEVASYLLSDLARNGTFETGAVIENKASASVMNWDNIIVV